MIYSQFKIGDHVSKQTYSSTIEIKGNIVGIVKNKNSGLIHYLILPDNEVDRDIPQYSFFHTKNEYLKNNEYEDIFFPYTGKKRCCWSQRIKKINYQPTYTILYYTGHGSLLEELKPYNLILLETSDWEKAKKWFGFKYKMLPGQSNFSGQNDYREESGFDYLYNNSYRAKYVFDGLNLPNFFSVQIYKENAGVLFIDKDELAKIK